MSLLMTSWAILTVNWLVWLWKTLCINWDPFNHTQQYTGLRLATWFWKTSVKLTNTVDLQPLSVKWYCNRGRVSEGLLHHFYCNTSKFLNCCLRYIHLSLASFFVVFKHKSLSFVNLSLFLHDVPIFWLEHLYISPKHPRPALKVHIL